MKKIMNLRHVETRAALRGGQRLLHAEPYEHDGRESDADVESKCINCGAAVAVSESHA